MCSYFSYMAAKKNTLSLCNLSVTWNFVFLRLAAWIFVDFCVFDATLGKSFFLYVFYARAKFADKYASIG